MVGDGDGGDGKVVVVAGDGNLVVVVVFGIDNKEVDRGVPHLT